MTSTSSRSVQFLTIPLARIDHLNDRFRITTREDIEDLASSIQTSGLISPPSVIETDTGYGIVSGFRRIAACRTLGLPEIFARVLATDTSYLDCLRIAITENALQRPLNLIETSRALQKLSKLSADLRQLAEIASSCGLPTNYAVIRKIRDLCLLPMPVQLGIVNDVIPLAMAGELTNLPHDVAVVIVRLFEQLKLSLNKQREIMMLVTEIARREGISIRQVLGHHKLLQLANSEELDRVQKTRQIRAFLRQWRFPRIVAAKQHFQHHVKNLKLGQDLGLIPPKDLEGNHYTLVFSFRNKADLKILQAKVDQIMQHPSFDEIIDD